MPVPECKHCYSEEKNKSISPRIRETVKWIKDPEVRSYLENWTPESEPRIYFYDFRSDSTCNLACIGCGPGNSTLWQRELGQVIDVKSAPVTRLEYLPYLKKIYLAGGEPFLIQQYLDILEHIVTRQLDIEVVINTNLTVMNDRIFKILNSLKNYCLIVSVDGHGSVNEYHRWPMSWKKFLKNLQRLTAYTDASIYFNTVVDAVSVFGLSELSQIENFAQGWNLSLLHDPPELLLKNVPDGLKHIAMHNLESFKQCKFYKNDITFKNQLNSACVQISESGSQNDLKNYVLALDKRRNINHTTYLGVNFGEI